MNKLDTNSPTVAGVISGDMTRHIREYLDFATCAETHSCGVYYFGIVGCACYFESVLEESAIIWCYVQKSKDAGFYKRLLEAVMRDVSRATGLEAWKKWMSTLFDTDFVSAVGEDWRPLNVLFKLRNQLAHGRTTKFMHFWRSDGQFLGMTLKGSSYEETVKYLLEKQVIRLAPGEVPSAELVLNASVVRHFLGVVDRALEALKRTPALESAAA